MNKTIEQLKQEAKQAREVAAMALSEVLPYGSGSGIADKLILAAVAMVTYQFALGMQEVSADGIGEALSEVSQEERDSDEWIEWNGGDRPTNKIVDVKTRDGKTLFNVGSYTVRWGWAKKLSEQEGTQIFCYPSDDIIAYRIAK